MHFIMFVVDDLLDMKVSFCNIKLYKSYHSTKTTEEQFLWYYESACSSAELETVLWGIQYTMKNELFRMNYHSRRLHPT